MSNPYLDTIDVRNEMKADKKAIKKGQIGLDQYLINFTESLKSNAIVPQVTSNLQTQIPKKEPVSIADTFVSSFLRGNELGESNGYAVRPNMYLLDKGSNEEKLKMASSIQNDTTLDESSKQYLINNGVSSVAHKQALLDKKSYTEHLATQAEEGNGLVSFVGGLSGVLTSPSIMPTLAIPVSGQFTAMARTAQALKEANQLGKMTLVRGSAVLGNTIAQAGIAGYSTHLYEKGLESFRDTKENEGISTGVILASAIGGGIGGYLSYSGFGKSMTQVAQYQKQADYLNTLMKQRELGELSVDGVQIQHTPKYGQQGVGTWGDTTKTFLRFMDNPQQAVNNVKGVTDSVKYFFSSILTPITAKGANKEQLLIGESLIENQAKLENEFASVFRGEFVPYYSELKKSGYTGTMEDLSKDLHDTMIKLQSTQQLEVSKLLMDKKNSIKDIGIKLTELKQSKDEILSTKIANSEIKTLDNVLKGLNDSLIKHEKEVEAKTKDAANKKVYSEAYDALDEERIVWDKESVSLTEKINTTTKTYVDRIVSKTAEIKNTIADIKRNHKEGLDTLKQNLARATKALKEATKEGKATPNMRGTVTKYTNKLNSYPKLEDKLAEAEQSITTNKTILDQLKKDRDRKLGVLFSEQKALKAQQKIVKKRQEDLLKLLDVDRKFNILSDEEVKALQDAFDKAALKRDALYRQNQDIAQLVTEYKTNKQALLDARKVAREEYDVFANQVMDTLDNTKLLNDVPTHLRKGVELIKKYTNTMLRAGKESGVAELQHISENAFYTNIQHNFQAYSEMPTVKLDAIIKEAALAKGKEIPQEEVDALITQFRKYAEDGYTKNFSFMTPDEYSVNNYIKSRHLDLDYSVLNKYGLLHNDLLENMYKYSYKSSRQFAANAMFGTSNYKEIAEKYLEPALEDMRINGASTEAIGIVRNLAEDALSYANGTIRMDKEKSFANQFFNISKQADTAIYGADFWTNTGAELGALSWGMKFVNTFKVDWLQNAKLISANMFGKGVPTAERNTYINNIMLLGGLKDHFDMITSQRNILTGNTTLNSTQSGLSKFNEKMFKYTPLKFITENMRLGLMTEITERILKHSLGNTMTKSDLDTYLALGLAKEDMDEIGSELIRLGAINKGKITKQINFDSIDPVLFNKIQNAAERHMNNHIVTHDSIYQPKWFIKGDSNIIKLFMPFMTYPIVAHSILMRRGWATDKAGLAVASMTAMAGYAYTKTLLEEAQIGMGLKDEDKRFWDWETEDSTKQLAMAEKAATMSIPGMAGVFEEKAMTVLNQAGINPTGNFRPADVAVSPSIDRVMDAGKFVINNAIGEQETAFKYSNVKNLFPLINSSFLKEAYKDHSPFSSDPDEEIVYDRIMNR